MLESLPTALTTTDLETLLAGFPSAAIVYRGDGIITVSVHPAGRNPIKLLSAASADNKRWHVMAKPGLITAKA